MFQSIIYTFFLISLVAYSPFDGLILPPCKPENSKRPFILSNETPQQEILSELSKIPSLEHGVHIGWSIEMNYKILATRKPKLAFLCDISSHVLEFYESFKQVLLDSNSSEEFLEQLQSFFLNNPSVLRYTKYKARQIDQLIERYATWMVIDDNFSYLKRMYQEEKILHLVLNMEDQEDRFDKIASWIKANNYKIDTVYTSNIKSVLPHQELFDLNLAKLIWQETIYICANRNAELEILY